MTRFEDVRKRIESSDFTAKMNLASGRSLFLRLLDGDPDLKALIELCKDDATAIDSTLAGVEELSRISINPRYENPHDVAMAAYCWALYAVAPETAKIGAAFASNARVTWWAREIAVFILENNITSQAEHPSSLTVSKSAGAVAPQFVFETTNFYPQADISRLPMTIVKDVFKYVLKTTFLIKAPSSDHPDSVSVRTPGGQGKPEPEFSFAQPISYAIVAAIWS